MGNEAKRCSYCKFEVPYEAVVCGHCGARFIIEELTMGFIYRFLVGMWRSVKFAFSAGILAAGIAYLLDKDLATWAVVGGFSGLFLGFIDGFVSSKTRSFERAERD